MSRRPRKFLCDVMLKGLASWLRAAGYDTALASDAESDRQLVTRARRENRCLLTRDRKLMEIKHAEEVAILLNCNDLHACATDLGRQIRINWCWRPFTRCTICNTLLETGDEHLWARVPEDSQQYISAILYCRHCDKVYWEGTHVRHMRQVLEKWQQDNPHGDPELPGAASP